MTETPAADIIERLRTTRLLSQRNQMALQCEAATEIEALRAREAELQVIANTAHNDVRKYQTTLAETQRKLDEAVRALEVISAKVEPEANRSNWEQIAMQDIEFATSALASIRGEADQ